MTPANAVTSESIELASIITPTFGRPESLPLLWLCIRSQTWANIEWLVDDDSPEPSRFMLEMADDKVRYFHNPARRSIGRKRNGLVAASRGSYIVHFDDDDYYSPHYISRMIASMTGAGAQICKLSSFFLFYKSLGVLAYWDLLIKNGLHFRWSGTGLIPIAVTEENNAQLLHMHLGFGFSYVYTRALWGRVKFKDINLHEDATFMLEASRANVPLLLPDNDALCLHILHECNTSQCFPQHVLPSFLGRLLFSGAERSYLRFPIDKI